MVDGHEKLEIEQRLEAQARHWHETCELVGTAANHEAKVVTGLVLASEPERFFTASDLQKAITERQGPQPAWIQNKTLGHQYCRDCLEPIGLAFEGTTQGSGGFSGREVKAFRFNQDAPDNYLAALGLIADWSLKWKHLSVQQVLGRSASKGDTKAVESRSNALMELLTTPNSIPAISEIEGISDVLDKTQRESVETLEQLGVVRIDNVVDNNDREFVIEDNLYRGRRSLENLRLETQLTYEFLGQRKVGSKFSKQELLDYIFSRISETDPDYDLAESRNYLTMRLAGGGSGVGNIPGVERLDTYNGGGEFDTNTRVQIRPGYVEPISELMDIIIGLDDKDPVIIALGKKRAKEIINNPQDVSELMAKALRFSPSAQSEGVDYKQIVLSIVRESEEPLDRECVRQFLAERGLKVGMTAVSEYLRELGKAGKLQAVKIRKDPTTKRQALAYIPTEVT